MFRSSLPFALLFALVAPTFPALAQVGPQPTPVPAPAPVPAVTPTPVPVPAPLPVPAATPDPQDPRKGDTPGTIKPTAPLTTPAATPAAAPNATPTPTPVRTIEDITKGYDKTEGVFTLYRKLERNNQKLLAEVKQSQIGPLFLLQSTFASGNAGAITAGSPADDLVWRFEKTPDDRLILSVPNLWYRSSDPNLKQAVERDFPEAFLAGFPILARSAARGTVLIDFSSIFDGSIAGIATALQSPGGGPARGAYVLDSDLSFYESVKNFPTNMVVESRYNFKRVGSGAPPGASSAQADLRSIPVRVTYNLYPLPQGGYQPRLADPRVGFFINGQLSAGRTGFQTFDDDASADPRVVYINRWNLQKQDPSAKISAPVKPITFYLDGSIPVIYRDTVRDAILSWNRAFEPLGFKGAIVVKEAPLNDWDTADMRYNTIRWVASPPQGGSAYAVALMRENPLTGEIINAGINVNSNFVRVAYQEKQEVINPLDDVRKISAFGKEACQLGDEWIENARKGLETAQVSGAPIDNKTYVNQLLRGVVTHEFGHILGLRHNFVASTFLSPAQLKNPAFVRENGVSASVMDYVGYNVFGLKSGAPLFDSGPGKYDRWAISYGYTPVVAKSPQAERPLLKSIATRANEPGLAYQSDELSDASDPTIVRDDLSSDPLAYAEASFLETRQLLATLGARKPRVGETYATFTRRLRGLIRANSRDAAIAARFVGGVINRREVRGDKGERAPFSPVPIAEQRRALAILNQRIFAPGAFKIPVSYLSKTQADPYDFDDAGADAAYPIREDIARVRNTVLLSLFAPDRLNRIANTTWKFPGKTVDFPELFAGVRQGVWGKIGAKTVFSDEQRDLARSHLRILTAMSTEKIAAPADAKLVAFSELKTLKAALLGPRNSSPDAMTRLFIADTLRRIDAALVKKPE